MLRRLAVKSANVKNTKNIGKNKSCKEYFLSMQAYHLEC
jgi:hypothetical protein